MGTKPSLKGRHRFREEVALNPGSESADLIVVHHIKENDFLFVDSHKQSPPEIQSSLVKRAAVQSAKSISGMGMGITHEFG